VQAVERARVSRYLMSVPETKEAAKDLSCAQEKYMTWILQWRASSIHKSATKHQSIYIDISENNVGSTHCCTWT